jgi:NAD(P)-dependent dehydrogenase (short-subunit alcohol dehydrogenase family)
MATKVALVTAATEGIGFAIARRLATEGAHVVISSRKQANVDRAVKELTEEGLSVSGRVCHVGVDEQRRALVQYAVERFGKIDFFVSNAAVNPTTEKIHEMSHKAVDKLVDINLKSAIFLYQVCTYRQVLRRKQSRFSFWTIQSLTTCSLFFSLLPLTCAKEEASSSCLL